MEGIVNLDQRAIDLSAKYGPTVGPVPDLRPEDIDLLHAIAAAAG